MRRWLSLLLWSLAGAAMAQATISPQGIIVNPTPGDLTVTVWVDKDPGRSGNAVYKMGEPIRIGVEVNRDAYVYLFNVNADGSVDLILPNAYDRNNRLRAGEARTYPPKGARYEFTITGPEGENYVLALASLRPLSLGEIADVKSGRVNLKGLRNLSQTLSIIVRPVPNREWATDAIRYYVGRRAPPPPATGTLAIESSPGGAKVFIDGAYRGRTPLVLELRPGMHDVELRLEGYEPYRARVQVRAGQTTRLSPRLVRTVRTGTLFVDSSPQGAQVYVDGDPVGRTPVQLALDEGTHDVELRLEGYEPYRVRVQVRAGQTTRLSPRLVAVVRTGTLEVTSTPDGAEVYVDGVYRGRTRLLMELEAGMHDVEVRMDGYTSYRARVRVDPGATTRVFARLTAAKATLDLSVNVDAQVFLDGYFLGKTKNGRLVAKVSPGNRELVVIAPGYHVYVETVRLEPGGYHKFVVRLQRIR
ncbi:PEGA domain-containing protein [Oceanithermus sp.]